MTTQKFIPKMLLIGALEKNSGKTSLSVNIIQNYSKDFNIYAVKATILKDFEGKKGFNIVEENKPNREKDTGRLLAAGANKVYWLKTDEEHVCSGFEELLKKIPSDVHILCESNSIRKYIKPGVFLMVQRNNPEGIKKTAAEVEKFVDKFIVSEKINDKIIYKPDVMSVLKIKADSWQLD